MAYDVSQKRMCLCYDNRITPLYVSSVDIGGSSFTADPGYPVSNLAFEDPSLILRVTTPPSGDPIIDITTSSVSATCLGFANHTICTAGYDYIAVGWWDGNTYQPTGGNQSLAGVVGNPNFFLRFSSQTSTKWRITLLKISGGKPAFSIGLVFLGKFYEVAQNPNDGGVFSTTSIESEPLVAMGGTKYERAGAVRATESAEISFERIPSSMVNTIRGTIFEPSRANAGVVGVIWPGDVSYAMPTAAQHFYGRFESLTYSPRYAAGPPHPYDLTLALKGIL